MKRHYQYDTFKTGLLFVLKNLLLGLFILHSFHSVEAQTPQIDMLKEIKIKQRLNEQIPMNLSFNNEEGESILLKELIDDKPVILSLVYYECPMLCTLVLNGLLRSLRALPLDVGKDFDIITVSFDPEETSSLASKKKDEYIKQYGRENASDGWNFLTGKKESIDALTDAVGFQYRYLPDSDEFAHSSAIMVITPEGKLSKYFYGC